MAIYRPPLLEVAVAQHKVATQTPITLTSADPSHNLNGQKLGNVPLLSARNGRMKTLLTKLRDVAISGFFALFPIYAGFLIFTKAWTHLTAVGAKISATFGLKTIFGIHAGMAFTGLLIVAIWFVSGLLVRISVMNRLSAAMEQTLAKFLPGYATYREMAEEKLLNKVKVLPYTSALIKWQEYWQPGYIVEQDQNGNCVVFLPDIPDTKNGRLLLARHDQLRVLSSVTANQLDALLRETGRGLLSEYGIVQDRFSKVS